MLLARRAQQSVAPALRVQPLAFSAPHRRMTGSRSNPRNPGEGGGFFGLNPEKHTQTDAQKFDTFHAGHKIPNPLELQGGQNPASSDFNAGVWEERNQRYTGSALPAFGASLLI